MVIEIEEYIEKRTPKGKKYFENSLGKIVAKVCSKCEKIVELEGFYNEKKKFDGKSTICKPCMKKQSRKYYEENPEKYCEQSRSYRKNNIEKVREYNVKYNKENSERIREKEREYRKANVEKIRERARKYYEENFEKLKEYNRKYSEENAEKISEINRKRYKENCEEIKKRCSDYKKNNPEKNRKHSLKGYRLNPEKYNANGRKHRQENPEKYVLYAERRRARRIGLPDTLTTEQWLSTVYYFSGCALTGSSEFIQEHALPVSIGHGGTTYENITPMRADLNASKNASHIFEWFDANREYFGLSQYKFDKLIEYLADINEMTPKEYRMYVDWCFDNPRINDDRDAMLDAL